MTKSRECSSSCLEYLNLELVRHYQQQKDGPSLQVRSGCVVCLMQAVGASMSAPGGTKAGRVMERTQCAWS